MKTPVIHSDFLINFLSSDKSRGMALGYIILIRPPDKHGWVTSETGSKQYDRVLKHEQEHIKRQKEMGVLIWLYKYITDKDFKESEEAIARMAETT